MPFAIFLIPILFLAFVIFSSIVLVKEYERGVVYTLGKYSYTIGAGLKLVIPFVQEVVKVDMRVRTEDIPPQDVISADNVSIKVNAVLYYRIIEPSFALNRVENFYMATNQLAQTTLRAVLGKHELDEILSKRDELNDSIQKILDQQTDSWGIKMANVEIKDVDIDTSMVRAIAKQAEAERERRAKVINAEGELQAAKQLDEAATILAQRPETMQLRYLGTMSEFSGKGSSTIVLPLPLDLLKGVLSGK